jgi:hypothetical protein
MVVAMTDRVRVAITLLSAGLGAVVASALYVSHLQ